jgi:hypothetical protein
MKTLYLIILILLLTACGSQSAAEFGDQPLPTIPADWLTKPPTPEITPVDPVQQSQLSENEPNDTARSSDSAGSQVLNEQEEPTPTPTLVPTSTATFHLPKLLGRQWTISAEPGVPAELISSARALAGQRPDEYLWVEPGSLPTDITLRIGGENALANWTYVVAAPFATLEDDISVDELVELWSSVEPADRSLYLTGNAAGMMREKWGRPGANLSIIDEAELVQSLWDNRPSLTVLPFEQLTPELKVLTIDGLSPFSAEFAPDEYTLQVSIGIDGEMEGIDGFLAVWEGEASNFDPDKLTTVAMTGVTALVRATAAQMEIDGTLSPAVDVGPVLRGADFAHISNEVSFDANCPEPSPYSGTSFCSQDEYFTLLEEIGTDIVELTGNHLNDWGADNVGRTIDMYEAAGMDYFGGGLNNEDAKRAAIIEHNDNKIALVGCNYFGPVYAWTTETTAGSRQCGPDFFEQIERLNQEGYVVITTQQYTEYYQYPPTPDQEYDFHAIADAGAAAVSGSQGHHAQGFDFYNGAFIHYGLGNLFFDQMDMLGTRQAFVDTYSVYDGRLINVDLWVGLIENFSTPRTASAAERRQALQSVFEASGW